MKTKEECIGKEYLKFKKNLSRIKWLYKFLKKHRLKKIGDTFVYYNGADHIHCVLLDIGKNYSVIYAPKNSDGSDIYNGDQCGEITMDDDFNS